jgi:Ca2+-binding RTX toxin-like protein
MFEILESRRLMSVSATFTDGAVALTNDSETGGLLISGGSAGSVMQVTEDSGNVKIFDVNSSGVIEMAEFNSITSIKINLGSGNDALRYDGNTIGASISGNDGDDLIAIYDHGAASSTVSGGAGNDELIAIYSSQAVLNGGAGNDTFRVNSGSGIVLEDFSSSDITVNGGSGDDLVWLYDGTVEYNGGSGVDALLARVGDPDLSGVVRVETIGTGITF